MEEPFCFWALCFGIIWQNHLKIISWSRGMYLCLTLLCATNEGLRHWVVTCQPGYFCSGAKKKDYTKGKSFIACRTSTSFDFTSVNLLWKGFLSQLQIYHLSKCSLNQLDAGFLVSCMGWIEGWQMFILYCIRVLFQLFENYTLTWQSFKSTSPSSAPP